MNNRKAPISIIIPTYQHGLALQSCLSSVFAQTIEPEEIIVIDDGSTDGTREVLLPYENRLIVIHQENQGVQKSRNRGYEIAQQPYLLFLDADVVMRFDMLEKMYEKLQKHPEASYVYSGFRFFWKRFSSFPFDPAKLEKMNFIHTSSLMLRDHFPGFDVSLKKFHDWDIWLSMLKEGHIGVFIDEELFRITQAGDHRVYISKWLPKYIYQVPWSFLGWKPASVDGYEKARDVIYQKHQIQ